MIAVHKFSRTCQQFSCYIKDHGFCAFCATIWQKLWWKFSSKEILYTLDVSVFHEEAEESCSDISTDCYQTVEEIPERDLTQLSDQKNKATLSALFDNTFEIGAALWLVKKSNQIVGHFKTLCGGFDGFYSIPISDKDVIIMSVEIFPSFRGQRLCPQMFHALTRKLKESDINRAHLKVNVNNKPMQKSLEKTEFAKIGVIRCLVGFGKYVVVWDRKRQK